MKKDLNFVILVMNIVMGILLLLSILINSDIIFFLLGLIVFVIPILSVNALINYGKTKKG